MPLVAGRPGKNGHIGNRVGLAGNVGASDQVPVEDIVEPGRLIGVAIDRVGVAFRGKSPEVMGLAQHRPRSYPSAT